MDTDEHGPHQSWSMHPKAERPVPIPQHMVSDKAPQDQQMKAIAYMVAMRAPRPDDANVDTAYANDLAEKLKPISLSLDPGPDKGKWNNIEIVASGRQIDLNMSQGCDDKTANKAVVQRLSTPFATLARSTNGARWRTPRRLPWLPRERSFGRAVPPHAAFQLPSEFPRR